jgi:Porin subfamily
VKAVRSLILGSTAGLVAMGGAQAADLPVKAKAVEYVRICSLYGAGFYYIPGTDTCIKLSGYLRVDFVGNSNFDAVEADGLSGAANRLRNYFTARSREDFNIDTRTATEYGVVRTFWGTTFSWTTPNPILAGTFGNAGVAGSDQPGVFYAFIQFAGFMMGKAISPFSTPWTNYPANAFDGLVGGGGTVSGVNQLTYTADLGQGMSFAVSAQDPTAYYQAGVFNSSFPGVTGANIRVLTGSALGAGTPYGVNSQGGSGSPDFVAMFRVIQAWGLFQASLAAHDNHANYYLATNETSGHPADAWGWAAQLGLSIKNIPTGEGDTINMSAVYTDGASRYNFQDLGPTTFVMFGGTSAPGAYQSFVFAQANDTVFANGTSQQLTQTWGMRGGYTHNWDPHWNSTIFGAYAAVRFNSTAQAMICTNMSSIAVAGTGFSCNPNFNIAQIGVRTAWTPIKNLTFSGDVVWTEVDQSFSGQVAVPAITGIAKPAADYEFKSQNTVTLLLRAQRSW